MITHSNSGSKSTIISDPHRRPQVIRQTDAIAQGLAPLKALSLHQPWADLCVQGHKIFETRSWATKHRGLLAIHSTRHMNAGDHLFTVRKGSSHIDWIRAEFAEYLPDNCSDYYGGMSSGGIEGIVRLLGIYPAEHIRFALERQMGHRDPALAKFAREQLAFGDFSDGRYAWHLEPVCGSCHTGLVRGYQGLWTVPQPVTNQIFTALKDAGYRL
jgi:hypothetical protein